jgi:hypothetical protein
VSRLLITAILAVFSALALWYSASVPLGEAPDELPHFTYVRYLAQNGRLPTTTEEHEAFQPPFYYALGAALTFWIEDESDAAFAVRANANFDAVDPRAPKNLLLHTSMESFPYRGWALAWHLVRLLSIALGAITVWAVYRLGRVLFPSQPAIGLTMAALTAFTPQFIFVSSVANNDNAAIAFSALILWQVALLLHERDCSHLWRRSIVLGILLGLGLLSKVNLLALLPIVGLAVVLAGYLCHTQGARSALRQTIVALVVLGGLALIVSGWYFARNWLLYGDPLGWSFLLEINARREGPLTVQVLAWLGRGVFRSFWLGWIGIAFDEAIYALVAATCLVGAAGFVARLVSGWWGMRRATRWTLVLLALQSAVTVGSLIQWTATVQGTDQGRLIFPILPVVMLVLAAGWAWWARGKATNWILGGLALAMLSLAIASPVRYIGPVHAPAPAASETELAASQPLNVEWPGVRLLGYRLEENQVLPGGKLALHLYWQGLEPMERDLMALIQLIDSEGDFLMYSDGSPTAGRDTTDRWPTGVPLASLHLLPIPDYGQPGEYRLTISLHPFGEQTWLPAVGPEGAVLGEQFALPETIRILAH